MRSMCMLAVSSVPTTSELGSPRLLSVSSRRLEDVLS